MNDIEQALRNIQVWNFIPDEWEVPLGYDHVVIGAKEALATLREAIEDRDRLQHIMDCANTPLMADVLKERDALKAENDKLITDISHLQHDLLYEEQAKLKAEATLIEGRPLLEAVKKAEVWPDGETRIWKEEQDAILRAALAYKEQMGKDNG